MSAEKLARAIVEIDGIDPDQCYWPKGPKGKPITMWELYGLDKANRILALVERRYGLSLVEKAASPSGEAA